MPAPQPASESRKSAAIAAPAKQQAAAGPRVVAGTPPAPSPKAALKPTERADAIAVRAKLAVSQPGDPLEKDADGAAEHVMRAPPEENDGHRAPAPRTKGDTLEPVKVARRAAGSGPVSGLSLPADIAQDLGPGHPLDAETREFFESRYRQDLTAVRVHEGAKAHEAAQRIDARAFTVGHDIAFAAGQYQPGTHGGRTLLAHEIAHVLQQEDGLTRMVMRKAAEAGSGPGGNKAPKYTVETPFLIPPIKSRHAPAYGVLADKDKLVRPRGYSAASRKTAQVDKWIAGVKIEPRKHVPADFQPKSGGEWQLPLQREGGTKVRLIKAKDEELVRILQRPDWDAAGVTRQFQVDHMIEYQVGGLDELDNFELLQQEHNASVGSGFNHEINNAIRAQLAKRAPPPAQGVTPPAKPDVTFVKENYDIVFKNVEGRGRQSRRGESTSTFWSRQSIENLEHVTTLLPSPPGALGGKADEIVLQSPTGQVVIGRFRITGKGVEVRKGQSGGMAGFSIEKVNLDAVGGPGSINGLKTDAPSGQLEGTLDFGKAVQFEGEQDRCSLALQKASHAFALRIATNATPGKPGQPGNFIPAKFKPLSPMEITDLAFGKGVYASSWIRPSHPALAGINIPAQVRDGKVGFYHTVDTTAFANKLRIPGVTIDNASITLGYDGVEFSAAGGAEFTIRNFGVGSLNARVDTSGMFNMEGMFQADPRLFDTAQMRLWYRSDKGFGGAGTLGITSPNRIRGIKRASIHAKYERDDFTAKGEVEPNIPGLKNASLDVRYAKDKMGADSLLIGGELDLAAGIPGVEGGKVQVQLEQKQNGWRVSGEGDLKPKLPGMDSKVHVSYDDGLFGGEASATYKLGILDGDVTVGMTNRAVSPDGQVSGAPGNRVRLYGGGTLNATIGGLRGGVGVKVRPTGDLRIGGRLGIAKAATLFEQFPPPDKARRELLGINLPPIPLWGFPLGQRVIGISLQVSGKLTGYAFVGPGLLTQADVNVEEFDPKNYSSLRVRGNVQVQVPAKAGVEGEIKAEAVGDAAVVQIRGGIGITAGVEVAAPTTASAKIDWSPRSALHIAGKLEAKATPRLVLGVNATIQLIAKALVTDFSLWEKKWDLAKREVGSSFGIDVIAPVDYYSDQRGIVFDPSKVDIKKPELTMDTFKQLFASPTQESTEPKGANPREVPL